MDADTNTQGTKTRALTLKTPANAESTIRIPGMCRPTMMAQGPQRWNARSAFASRSG